MKDMTAEGCRFWQFWQFVAGPGRSYGPGPHSSDCVVDQFVEEVLVEGDLSLDERKQVSLINRSQVECEQGRGDRDEQWDWTFQSWTEQVRHAPLLRGRLNVTWLAQFE